MLKYLIIQLDDTSTSYCHYVNNNTVRHLIGLDELKAGVLFAMKENLMIQFVYPDYELSQEYKDVINTIDHCDIVSSVCEDEELRDNADIIVFHDWTGVEHFDFKNDSVYVLRTSKAGLFDRYALLKKVIARVARLNVVITDIETFNEHDFDKYNNVLSSLSEVIEQLYVDGKSPQLNLLTDRMLLEKMNNCNAGWENITLAPDGKFYICPAFYLVGKDENDCFGKLNYSVGDVHSGIDIKNPQLYKLDYAPLCRNCDAYQCKRCVWLNRKTTYEVNTPSHEQCVTAHIERNTSRNVLYNIRKFGIFLPDREIKEISYLDPFDVKDRQ